MQTINANGASLSLALFTKAFKAARKLAPARFLTLRIHPAPWKKLVSDCEEITEIVQVGETVGHLGKRITKVACVPALNGLGDGVAVKQDAECDESRFEFQIHGATELEIVGLYVRQPVAEQYETSQTIQ